MKNRFKIFTILSALACLGLAFGERALATDDPPGPMANGDAADGFNALGNSSPGAFNSAFGWFSQGFGPTFGGGLGNTSIGAGSLDIGGGNFNTADGAGALLLNFSTDANTAVGFEALLFNDNLANSLAFDNTAVGFQALLNNVDAFRNTAVGSGALFNNDVSGAGAANENTAVGFAALGGNGDGFGNTAVGIAALEFNDGGFNSTAVGNRAGFFSVARESTAVGAFALAGGAGFNTGIHNAAFGFAALNRNTSGFNNTATGHSALITNTIGRDNTADGWQALRFNVNSIENTAVGSNAGLNIVGTAGVGQNTVVGDQVGTGVTTGVRNVTMGRNAGAGVTSGNDNVILGANAAAANIATRNNNIIIGSGINSFANFEDNFIRIRDSNAQQAPVIATSSKVLFGGIFGATIPNVGAPQTVKVNSRGQLAGIVVSSARYKKDIKPMDKASESILALKPVTFHYKEDPTNTLSFGLIAEDVAKVAPELAIMDKEGKPLSVLYEEIPIRLLNEFLKEHKKVEQQQAAITELKSTVAQQQKGMEVLTAQLKEQAAQIQRVSAQLEVSKPAPQVVVNKP
jgi:hypothetical protein